jgi:hypothetical protein
METHLGVVVRKSSTKVVAMRSHRATLSLLTFLSSNCCRQDEGVILYGEIISVYVFRSPARGHTLANARLMVMDSRTPMC